MANKTFQVAFEIGANLSGGFLKAFSGASGAMSKMQGNIKSMKTYTKSLDAGYKAGTISATSYAANHEKIAKALEREEKAQRNLARAAGRQKKAQRNLARAAGRQKNVKDKRQGFRDDLWNTAELAMTVAAPVSAAMGMESAMADVKKVVDFDTPQQFKEMRTDIIGLSKVIPMTAENLAKIVAAGGQSGIAKEDLLGFAESAAKMGIAFDVSADEAGEMMAKWRTAFKMSQPEVVELADKINYLGNNTAASAPKISDVVRRIGPLGEVGGVASGEIAALGASMIGAGIESEVAATGIKNMILGLVSGEGATQNQAAAFAMLGLDAKEMAKRMQTDAKGAIIDVLSKIKEMDKYQQASVLKDLFGSESLSAIAPLLGNLDNLQKNLGMVADKSKYTGSMQAEFAARIETTEAKLQLAKNAVVALGVQVGGYLLPIVQKGAEGFATITDMIANFANEYPNATKWIAVGTATFFAGTIAISAFGYAVLGLIYPFTKLWAFMEIYKTSMKIATVGQWLFNTSLLGCPIVWIAAGILTVVAAGYLLYKNWDMITAFISNEWKYVCGVIWNEWAFVLTYFSGAWEAIKNMAVNAYDGFIVFWKQLPSDIAYAVGFAIDFITIFVMKVPAYFSQMVSVTGAWLKQLPILCYSAGSAFVSSAEAWLSQSYATATMWISNTITGVGTSLMRLPGASIEAGEAFIASVSSWAEGAYNAVSEWIGNIPTMVSEKIASAGSSISGWWSGVTSSFGGGYAAASGETVVAENARGGIYSKGAFLTTFAEESPEAAIPLDGSPRAVSLWQEAGGMLGVKPTGGGGSITATFAPQIHIAGNADAGTVAQIQQVMQESLADFERKLAALQNQQKRVSYA